MSLLIPNELEKKLNNTVDEYKVVAQQAGILLASLQETVRNVNEIVLGIRAAWDAAMAAFKQRS